MKRFRRRAAEVAPRRLGNGSTALTADGSQATAAGGRGVERDQWADAEATTQELPQPSVESAESVAPTRTGAATDAAATTQAPVATDLAAPDLAGNDAQAENEAPAPVEQHEPPRVLDTRRRVDDQLAAVLNGIGALEPIEVTILDAQGLTLAEDVRSTRALPGFDNSAMDGYAVRAVDVADATEQRPVELPVVGDIAAGSRSVSGMGPGLAMRIMTGAPMPAGADAVVRVEDTDGGVARVNVRVSVPSGQSVRRAGEDMPAGRLALGSGAALGPQQIGLLAAIGRERVLIRPRPRVVVISTGDELVDVGHEPALGQLPDSNSYLLTAAARDAGAEAYRIGIVADDHSELMELLEAQLLRADVIVTSGGVSMGAYDVVKEALSELGTVDFTRVAMQPGKPQGFGHIGPDATPIFCLPGNPVSALVSFEVFVRPAIRKLLGKRRLQRATVAAVALERIPGSVGTRQYRRGLLHREADGTYSVSTVGGTGSHLIAALAASNCLIVVDENLAEVVPGSRVPVIPLLLSQR